MTLSNRLPCVGFIGLGVMGRPMATHLARAGYPMRLFDVAPGFAGTLAASLGDGAQACATPKELARDSEIVVTMVPNGEVVRDLVTSDDGLLAAMAPGTLLLDTSSSEPWLTEQSAALLAARGVANGRRAGVGALWGAEAAELVFMVGGAAADVERVRPLLDVMGKAVFHLGPLAAGMR